MLKRRIRRDEVRALGQRHDHLERAVALAQPFGRARRAGGARQAYVAQEFPAPQILRTGQPEAGLLRAVRVDQVVPAVRVAHDRRIAQLPAGGVKVSDASETKVAPSSERRTLRVLAAPAPSAGMIQTGPAAAFTLAGAAPVLAPEACGMPSSWALPPIATRVPMRQVRRASIVKKSSCSCALVRPVDEALHVLGLERRALHVCARGCRAASRRAPASRPRPRCGRRKPASATSMPLTCRPWIGVSRRS